MYVLRDSTPIPHDLVLVMKGIITAFKINSKRVYTINHFVPNISSVSINDKMLVFELQNYEKWYARYNT